MRNFFLTILIPLLLISCGSKNYFLKKRYSWGYRALSVKDNEFTDIKKTKNTENRYNYEKNEDLVALNLKNTSNKSDIINGSRIFSNNINNFSKKTVYRNNLIHQIGHVKLNSNQYKSLVQIKKKEFNKNYSKKIPLYPESGSFFYVWGILGSIFLAFFLATLYFLIISGIILITYNPNLFLYFIVLFILAGVVIGILYLMNAD